ncbi:hypothetical protein AC1031_006638 [Aphanomyces cochlioides]|nr:hypothetical protein AC1031_006638 [Aphanomyces cochlioides]
MSLLTSITSVFRGGKDDNSGDNTETERTENIPVDDDARKTASLTKLDNIRQALSTMGKLALDFMDDEEKEEQQHSPPRRRWTLLPKVAEEQKAKGESTDEVPQEPSPPSHRRRWSLLPMFTEDLKATDLSIGTEVDVEDDDDEDDQTPPQPEQQPSPVSSHSIDSRPISEIQTDAQRVCSVLSGDAKRHLKILRSIDPSNLVLADVRKAITEANVWLAECIAPTSGDAECLKEAKITQQYHAERCLLDANAMALAEIKRLSDLATSNATAPPPAALLRTKSF